MKRYAQFLGTPDAWVGAAPASWTAVDTSVTCHTVVVDVGPPGAPQYVLTQAQSFLARDVGPGGAEGHRSVRPGRAVAPRCRRWRRPSSATACRCPGRADADWAALPSADGIPCRS